MHLRRSLLAAVTGALVLTLAATGSTGVAAAGSSSTVPRYDHIFYIVEEKQRLH